MKVIVCKGELFLENRRKGTHSIREGENKSDPGGFRNRSALMCKMQQYPVKMQKKAFPKICFLGEPGRPTIGFEQAIKTPE
ncbi:MAG: hypothetical protein ACI8V2_001956 [Candidatus Latescibacterota bacterium]|jgi:hypothetical protein